MGGEARLPTGGPHTTDAVYEDGKGIDWCYCSHCYTWVSRHIAPLFTQKTIFSIHLGVSVTMKIFSG